MMGTKALCRICFEIGHFSLIGYEVNVEEKSIPIEKMIQRFSDIELISENVPDMICEACAQDLVQSYLFADKIHQADIRILSLFCSKTEDDQSKDADSSEVDSLEKELSQNSQETVEIVSDNDDIADDHMESQLFEEIYVDNQVVEENTDETASSEHLSMERRYSKPPQIVLTEGVSSLLSNYEICKEGAEEPKRKVYCRRREKPTREIDGSGSFVITQFTSSAASKLQLDNMIPDDTDEVTLSDIRTMNFETVEVNANNMEGIKENDQGELPIDDSRVYLCQYCPKAFSSSLFLIAHVRKSHACTYCAKMFTKSTELFQHIREVHTSFKCVVCEKEFSSNSNLRNHLKTIHKLRVPANVALLSYKKSRTKASEEDIDVEDERLSS